MKLTNWMSFVFFAAILTSCYPEKDRTLSDYDIVGTRFSDGADFTQYKTYFLYDSVIIVYDSTEEKPDYPKEAAAVILNTMQQNLFDYGWIEALPGDTPDVYIEASTWTSEVSGAIYYPGWGYPGWGYPGWGYPGYPGWGYPGWGTSYYSYTTGTVMMYIMDVENYAFDDTPADVLWSGGLNGILSSTSSSNLNRIEYSVNQAFVQSPYLKLK